MYATLLTVLALTGLLDVAHDVSRKAADYIDPGNYQGAVYLQGLSEMAAASGDEALSAELAGYLDRYADGSLTGRGSFISYRIGGTAAAQAAWRGGDRYRQMVTDNADRMWREQKRNEDGLMVPYWAQEGKNLLFADIVLAVTPFFLYDGLLEEDPERVDYAVEMLSRTVKELRDPATGLVHQARGVKSLERGQLSEDCWSRGNGWVAMAFAALLHDLPPSHPRSREIRALARSFFTAVLRYQDADGLWHQEMTWQDSYTEISGSALLLYGLGAALEAGILPRKARQAFEKGLRGLLAWIGPDGTIGNTCSGCLAYGDGTKVAYASHPYYYNEPHAFGAVLLALSEAWRLGFREVDAARGSALGERLPQCHVRCIKERCGDIAWENDRLAFRIYSRDVRAKVGSGVDFWTKSTDLPVVEQWYAGELAGASYHRDRGEGYDFYNVGRSRGLGGTGVWQNDSLWTSEPYANFRIFADRPDLVDFAVSYQPYPAGEDMIYETKRITMRPGTYFYEVTETLETGSGAPAVLAVGLTDFGKGQLTLSPGRMALVEDRGQDGWIAGAVIAPASVCRGVVRSGRDHLLLLEVPSGGTVRYRVGAAWSRDLRLEPLETRWPRMVKELK